MDSGNGDVEVAVEGKPFHNFVEVQGGGAGDDEEEREEPLYYGGRKRTGARELNGGIDSGFINEKSWMRMEGIFCGLHQRAAGSE